MILFEVRCLAESETRRDSGGSRSPRCRACSVFRDVLAYVSQTPFVQSVVLENVLGLATKHKDVEHTNLDYVVDGAGKHSVVDAGLQIGPAAVRVARQPRLSLDVRVAHADFGCSNHGPWGGRGDGVHPHAAIRLRVRLPFARFFSG